MNNMVLDFLGFLSFLHGIIKKKNKRYDKIHNIVGETFQISDWIGNKGGENRIDRSGKFYKFQNILPSFSFNDGN